MPRRKNLIPVDRSYHKLREPLKSLQDLDGTLFGQYVRENQEYYITNKLKKYFDEPYTQKNTDMMRLQTFVEKLVPEELLMDTYTCTYCGEEYQRTMFDPQVYCHKKHCKGMHASYAKADKILDTPKEVNNEFQRLRMQGIPSPQAYSQMKAKIKNKTLLKHMLWHKCNPDRYWICPVTGWIIPLQNFRNHLVPFLESQGIDVVSYYLKHLSQFIKVCKLCGQVVKICYDLHNFKKVGKMCSWQCKCFQQVKEYDETNKKYSGLKKFKPGQNKHLD
jgi:hypothetical protein